jgi:predicted aspartyl protease
VPATSVHAEPRCVTQPVAIVRAAATDNGLLTLPARIDGSDLHVLLDTGSDWNLIAAPFATALGLRPRRLARPYLDAGGGGIQNYVRAQAFSIGEGAFVSDFVLAPALDGDGYAAAVGAIALSAYDVEIVRGVVTFHRPQKDCVPFDAATRLPFGFDARVPEFDVLLDGRRVRAVLDTGASHTLIDTALARRLFGLRPGSPGLRSLGEQRLASGRQVALHAYRFKELSVGTVGFDDVEIVVGEFPVAPFTLGMREAARLHLYLAFEQRMIYASRLQ